MIHLGLILPLAVSGIAGALWRDYRQAHQSEDHSALLVNNAPVQTERTDKRDNQEFDDVSELDYYQRSSWLTLALTASGSWFYAPALLFSVPLLGYNGYHFFKTLRHSAPAKQKSPVVVFETIAIAGSFVSGRFLTTSVLMIMSFGLRNLLLRAGNIAHHADFKAAGSSQHATVWVLCDGIEVQTAVNELESGDIVVLRPDDTVVVSGRVIDGAGDMRQYSLQRKVKSVSKQKGDLVFPFTRLESGHLHVEIN